MSDKTLAQLPRVLAGNRALAQFLAMNRKVVGRDKVYRVVQYLARFLAWLINSQAPSAQDTIAKLRKLEAHFSIGRKCKT